MKTIIVATDFSPASEQATQYAAEIGKTLQLPVLLLHVYQLPVTMNDVPVLLIPVEDLKNNAEVALKRVKETAEKNTPDVKFITQSRLGDLEEELEAAAKETDTLCIVVGHQKSGGLESFLIGNEAFSLVKKSSYPMIVLSEGEAVRFPKNIALAVDLKDSDSLPVEKIMEFVQLFDAQLHTVHIKLPSEEAPDFQPLQNSFRALELSSHVIESESVTEGMKSYLTQNPTDLLIVLPQKHGFFERLFNKEHTPEIINELSIPVLSIRS